MDVEQAIFNDIAVVDCLNDMVDKVCSDFDKCTGYLNNINAVVDTDATHNEEISSLKNNNVQSTKRKPIPRPRKSVKLKFKLVEEAKAQDTKKTKDSNKKMSTITEHTKEDTFQEEINPETNENEIKLKTPKNTEAALLKRKRKLYSPKDDDIYDKIQKTAEKSYEVPLSEIKIRYINQIPKTSATCYKELEKERKKDNTRLPRIWKSKAKDIEMSSPRTPKMNLIFENLKHNFENNESIKLVEKNSDDYNFTSDSEDKDFQKKKINMKKKIIASTIKRKRPRKSVKLKFKLVEEAKAQDTKKTKDSNKKMSTITEHTKEDTFQEEINPETNENEIKLKTPKNTEAALLKRKRKLYSPKDDDIYDKIQKTAEKSYEVPLSEIKIRYINQIPKTSATCYKELEKERKKDNTRLPRIWKSKAKDIEMSSPRTPKMNLIFENLKHNFENNESIKLVEKNSDDYNFTSDSEDKDFQKKKINMKKKIIASTIKRKMVTKRTKKKADEKNAVSLVKVSKFLDDERMREVVREDLNTSILIHHPINPEPEEIKPVITEVTQIEAINDSNDTLTSKKSKKTQMVIHDEQYNDTVSPKKRVNKRAKKTEPLYIKKEKGLALRNNFFTVSDTEDERTMSPLPGLVVESTNKDREDINETEIDKWIPSRNSDTDRQSSTRITNTNLKNVTRRKLTELKPRSIQKPVAYKRIKSPDTSPEMSPDSSKFNKWFPMPLSLESSQKEKSTEDFVKRSSKRCSVKALESPLPVLKRKSSSQILNEAKLRRIDDPKTLQPKRLIDDPKRKVEILSDVSIAVSGPSVSSVSSWLKRVGPSCHREFTENVDSTSMKDTLQNIMERLDTTLVETNLNTSKKFENLFVESQKQIGDQMN